MAALVVLFIAAVLLIGPSFALLFRLQRRRLLAGEPGTLQPAGPAGRALPPRPPPGQSLPTEQSPAVRAAVLTLVTVAALVRRHRQS
jgi:hypothetical protein